jgi:hypothetical protein
MFHRLIVLVALVTVGCSGGGGGSPTAPSPPPAGPVLVSLTGTVSAVGGARLSGATVLIMDGANAGRSTQTSEAGEYRFDNLTAGNANTSASANGYETAARGIFIDGVNSLSFTLRPPTWTQAGSGNTVFDMPTYVSRVQIRGIWNGSGTSNFIVRVGGRVVVNEILREMPNRTYEGIHAVSGGPTEITNSSTITWAFTEMR